ncbi:MAG: hypothetical protein WC841_05285 [Candidatus Shapirobacteria bacterium]|jgi:hypothetical protein
MADPERKVTPPMQLLYTYCFYPGNPCYRIPGGFNIGMCGIANRGADPGTICSVANSGLTNMAEQYAVNHPGTFAATRLAPERVDLYLLNTKGQPSKCIARLISGRVKVFSRDITNPDSQSLSDSRPKS